MTASEMHISFKQGLDKFDSKNYPNILPEEIDLLLNQSQDAFVKQRYGYNNGQKQGFEEDQKRTEDLKAVVKTAIIAAPVNAAPTNINPYARFFQLPADHWITVQELATITFLDCNGRPVTQPGTYVQKIQHDDYSKLIDNPFGKPTNDKILRMVVQEGVELLASPTVTLNEYRLRYIKKPVRIDSTVSPSVDCELSDMVHQEVVNLAISIALENIEAQRIKTFIQVTENREE